MFNLIRTRIVASVITISLVVSLLFIGLGFIFSYEVEDTFFRFILDTETSRVESQLANKQPPAPYYEFVRYAKNQQFLPQAVASVLAQEPDRIEFSGPNDKHYHLKVIPSGYLVAEVSEQLIVRKKKGGMFSFALLIVGFILVIVAIVAWFLARRVTKPIKQLNNLLLALDEQALPQGFSKQFKRDEIGAFATILDSAFNRIQGLVDREKAFTRDASHELRTPIAISLGALTLLQETPLTKEQQTLVTRLRNAQNDMQQSVEGLLTMAREQSFEKTEVKLLPIVENAILMHHNLLDGKDIELDLQVGSEVTVLSNAEALKVIISNLISNAFRHTEQGVISVYFSNEQLILRDSGKGIDLEILQQVFEPGVKNKSSTGCGFGLAIVKRFCLRLDIHIELETNEYGCTFNLTFNATE